MKVFLSWSGEESKQVALALHGWLPSVIQALDAWMSSEDIEKGAKWSADLSKELANTRAGIVCVTPDNRDAPWLNFEAGALSKTVETTMVCTYLHRLKPTDLKGPLVQFQASEAHREDTLKMLATLNKAVQPKSLSEASLTAAFDLWWPKLAEKLSRITSSGPDTPATRSTQDMLEELLEVAREQARASNQLLILQLQTQQHISRQASGPLASLHSTIFPSPSGPLYDLTALSNMQKTGIITNMLSSEGMDYMTRLNQNETYQKGDDGSDEPEQDESLGGEV